MTLEDAQWDFIQRAEWWASVMAQYGVPIKWHSYYRSPAEQDELFRRGATKARGWQSPHNYGLAVDYHFEKYGWNVPGSWWKFGDDVARAAGLETGLSFGDANHLQGRGWKRWKLVA